MSWRLIIEVNFLLLLFGALGFGIAHAFEPDHMAAVSTFVAQRPKPREAALFGIRWAIGHGLSLFVIGSALYAFKRALNNKQPELFASGVLDQFVGMILVVLGLWTLWQVITSRASAHHAHGHFHNGHFHTHDSQGHSHSHSASGVGSLGMGLLHGAAGTGAFIGQSVVALSSSYLFVFFYTLLFSLGVLFSMAAYAGALGSLISLGQKRGTAVLSGARIVTGLLTCVIGGCLISGVQLPGLLDKITH